MVLRRTILSYHYWLKRKDWSGSVTLTNGFTCKMRKREWFFNFFFPVARAPAGYNDARRHVPFCCNTSHELTAGWNSCGCWIIGSVFNKQSYGCRCRPGLLHTALFLPSSVTALPLQACPNFLDWYDIPLCWTEPGHFLPSGRIAMGYGENRFWGFSVCLSNHILCHDRKAGLPHGVSSLIFFYFLIFVFFSIGPHSAAWGPSSVMKLKMCCLVGEPQGWICLWLEGGGAIYDRNPVIMGIWVGTYATDAALDLYLLCETCSFQDFCGNIFFSVLSF